MLTVESNQLDHQVKPARMFTSGGGGLCIHWQHTAFKGKMLVHVCWCENDLEGVSLVKKE